MNNRRCRLLLGLAVATGLLLPTPPTAATPPGFRLTLTGPTTTYSILYQTYRGRLSFLNQGIGSQYVYAGIIEIEVDGTRVANAAPREDGAFIAYLRFDIPGTHDVVAVVNRDLPTETRSEVLQVTSVEPPVPILQVTGYGLYRSRAQVLVWVSLAGEPRDATGNRVAFFTPVDGRVTVSHNTPCWRDYRGLCTANVDVQAHPVLTDTQFGQFRVSIGPFEYQTNFEVDPEPACDTLAVAATIHYVADGQSFSLSTQHQAQLCV